MDTDLAPLMADVLTHEATAETANIAAFAELLDLLRPVAAKLTRGWSAYLGRDRDGCTTTDPHDSIVLAQSSRVIDESGNGCGETEGFVAVLRSDGTVWGAPTRGSFWSARGGDSAWELAADLAPMTAADLAARFDAAHALRQVRFVLERRKGQGQDLAWRRQRITRALQGHA